MIVGVVVFVVAALLLTSIGGAGIVAAPITLPAIYLVVRRHPTTAFKVAGVVIGGLTLLEVAWAVVYLSTSIG